jgi:hypothetical protein
MNFDFYLFNVDHGQSAAARLPKGQWCLFDVGRSKTFSPVQFIINNDIQRRSKEPMWSRRPPWALAKTAPFSFLKATISHLHADHLDDYLNLFAASPRSLRTVNFNEEYLSNVFQSSSEESFHKVIDFCRRFNKWKIASTPIEYGIANINEKSFPLSIVINKIGGTPNNIVNNASIITRIDCYRNSILICGDMEEDAWEFALNSQIVRQYWRKLVSGIDILVAPHHGHSYSSSLMALADPSVVLISVQSKDESVDKRYTRRITTRDKGHIHLSIAPPIRFSEKGKRTWSYGDNC